MTVAQRSNADRMIRAKGQLVTIAGAASGTYDPATGGVTSSPYDRSGAAVLLPLAPYRKTDGTNIVAGDETLLLSALDNEGAALGQPPVNAVVTLADASTRTLVAVDPLRPAGLSIMFDCVVRGAA